jgi:hypothetical protein
VVAESRQLLPFSQQLPSPEINLFRSSMHLNISMAELLRDAPTKYQQVLAMKFQSEDGEMFRAHFQ